MLVRVKEAQPWHGVKIPAKLGSDLGCSNKGDHSDVVMSGRNSVSRSPSYRGRERETGGRLATAKTGAAVLPFVFTGPLCGGTDVAVSAAGG